MAIKLKYLLQLLAFPMLEVLGILFAFISWESGEIFLTFLLVFIAALAMNFSLHISYHYKVHHPSKKFLTEVILGLFISLLLGMPYRYYQFTHWNHHKHNNSIDDFSSTWNLNHGEYLKRNFWIYSIFWWYSPKYSLIKQIEIGTQDGYFTPQSKKLFVLEVMVNSFVLGLLVFYHWQLLIVYYSIIYLGWVFIAAHNYGQHLPDVYLKRKGFDFLNSLYNKIFLNNGLHEEHHEEPAKEYWDLKPTDAHQSQNFPPLIDPLFFQTKK